MKPLYNLKLGSPKSDCNLRDIFLYRAQVQLLMGLCGLVDEP